MVAWRPQNNAVGQRQFAHQESRALASFGVLGLVQRQLQQRAADQLGTRSAPLRGIQHMTHGPLGRRIRTNRPTDGNDVR